MKTILLTGAEGFIGRNIRTWLGQRSDLKLVCIDIGNSRRELETGLESADFIMHLAGVNRPLDPAEFETGNRGLTEAIVATLMKLGRKVPILISSSTQAAQDNPYGKSKLAAEEAIFSYGQSTGSTVYVFRLPNVFGKWCKPNYNSVIATWCHNTTHNLPIQINDPKAELILVYVDDVARAFIAAVDGTATAGKDSFYRIPGSYQRSLAQIAASLEGFKASRKLHVMPSLEDEFERRLYATWLSYLPENNFSYGLEMKHDDRGWLAEFIKSRSNGQIFVSKTKPGITRGNHWHQTKVEKFLVVSGQAIIKFRKTDGDRVLEYPVSGEELKVVDIPVGYTHSITNVGQGDLITIFWADEIFDPSASDTYFLEV